MTQITLRNNKVVMIDGKVGTEQGCCCDCQPCPHCSAACLLVTVSGFSSGSEGECLACDEINGEYLLSRGTGIKPTIAVSVNDTTGTGAQLSATLTYQPADGTYTISDVDVKKSGTCYSSAAEFAYTLTGAQVACDDPPVVTLEVERFEPDLDLSEIGDAISPAGSGAVLTPVYVPVVTDPGGETWEIGSVNVSPGGVNYETGQYVTVKTNGCTVALSGAVLKITADASAPSPVTQFIDTKNGSGATLSVTWTLSPSAPYGIQQWLPVLSVSGGIDYAINDNIVAEFPDGTFSGLYSSQAGNKIVGSVSDVGNDGDIVEVDTLPVAYFYSIGEIQSVTVVDGGEYYTPGGIKSATVVDGGTFWPTASCEYSVCLPTTCTVEGEPLCRKVTATVTASGVDVEISVDGAVVATATAETEGSPCDGVEFSPGEITSDCDTVGDISLAEGTCASGPTRRNCCSPPCDCTASLDGCRLVVAADFGDFQIEYINSPAVDYLLAGTGCKLSAEIADIPFEQGGDIGLLITLGFDAECIAQIESIEITHSEDCDDPNVTCLSLAVTLECE